MTIIVAFCLIFLSANSSAHMNSVYNDSADEVLSIKMVESGLSPLAQHLLGRNIFVDKNWRELTVADISRTKAELILGRAPEAEITEYLGRFGLRLGMTSHELDFYRKNGRLPDDYEGMTGETNVEALMLTPRSTRVLLNAGITRLADHRRFSLEDLRSIRNAGPVTLREIEAAFIKAGFPIAQTRTERCQESLFRDAPSRQHGHLQNRQPEAP